MAKKKDRTGEENINTLGYKMIIKEYRSCTDIDVYFPEHDYTFEHARYSNFKKGKIKCPLINKEHEDASTLTISSSDDNPNAGYICNGIKKSNVEVLHRQGFYGEGIKIGIVDTGIFPTHNFIKNNILCCKNFTNSNENDYIDKNNHGTFVASEIVQIAPKCKLVIARALDKDGNGTYDMIYNALKYCIEQDVDAINMSLGGTQGDERLHSLIQEANRKGIPVFTAGGNEGDLNPNTDENSYPGSYEECINVEAVNLDLTVPKYSNSNKYVDIVCVGTNLVGAYFDNKWCNSTGSSMAAPIACAIGMLLKEKFIKEWNREPSEKEIFGELLKHTKDLKIDKRQQGHGFLYIKED